MAQVFEILCMRSWTRVPSSPSPRDYPTKDQKRGGRRHCTAHWAIDWYCFKVSLSHPPLCTTSRPEKPTKSAYKGSAGLEKSLPNLPNLPLRYLCRRKRHAPGRASSCIMHIKRQGRRIRHHIFGDRRRTAWEVYGSVQHELKILGIVLHHTETGERIIVSALPEPDVGIRKGPYIEILSPRRMVGSCMQQHRVAHWDNSK